MVVPPTLGLDELRARAREVAHDVLAKDAAKVDAEARWPERGLRALLDAGLGGLVVPVEVGGLGQGLLSLVQVCEELGRQCASTSMCFGMHCVAAAVIAAKATPDHRQRFLEPIVAGKHLTSLALSEPGSGIHFYFPETKLESHAGGAYRVNGSKSFVTNGGHADSYVISTVAADENAPLGQFSCVVVPADASGLEWGEDWDGLGMRGNSSRSLVLRDVAVPHGDLLGVEGDQLWYIFQVVAPTFLAAMAGSYLGIASAALDEVTDTLSNRSFSHNGARLVESPLIQHRLGTLWAQVERTRCLLYHAAAESEKGTELALPALCSAKAEVADCSVEVVNQSMTLAGGAAYRNDQKLDRHLRDARAAHIMSPTTDLLRIWTGRALLGLPLLSD